MSREQQPSNDSRPIEELAGDAMQAVLTYTLRAAQQQVGADTTLDLLDEIEKGQARLMATLEIGSGYTRIICRALPKNASIDPFVVAAIDLIPPPLPTH